MKTPDPTFNQWKEEMRQDALENELKRLKRFSSRQSGIIQRLRRALLFISLFFVALFLMMIYNGLVQWPVHNSLMVEGQTNLVSPAPASFPEETTGQEQTPIILPIRILKPNQDTISIQIPGDGILFSVQIGAFTDMNLERFSGNMVSMYQDNYEGINQLSLGVFPHYPDAAEFLELIKKIGFSDAFVMATRNGRRIKIQDALMTRQKEQPNSKGGHANSMTRLQQ